MPPDTVQPQWGAQMIQTLSQARRPGLKGERFFKRSVVGTETGGGRQADEAAAVVNHCTHVGMHLLFTNWMHNQSCINRYLAEYSEAVAGPHLSFSRSKIQVA